MRNIENAEKIEDFWPKHRYTHLSVVRLLERRTDLEEQLAEEYKGINFFSPKDKEAKHEVYCFTNKQKYMVYWGTVTRIVQ